MESEFLNHDCMTFNDVGISYYFVSHLQIILNTFSPQILILRLLKHDLDYLMRLLERGKISPTVTKHITLDDVPHIHKEIEAGKMNGLYVCKPWKQISAHSEID